MANCADISKQDPAAGLICRELVHQFNYLEMEVASPVEAYTRAVEEATKEAQHNFDDLCKLVDAGKKPRNFKTPWADFLRHKAHMPIPFLLDDGKDKTRDDLKLLAKLAGARSRLKTGMDIYNFMEKELGVTYSNRDENADDPTALGAYRKHYGDCLNRGFLLYGLAVLLGKSAELYDQFGSRPSGDHITIRIGGEMLDTKYGADVQEAASIPVRPNGLTGFYHYNRYYSQQFCKKSGNEKCLEDEMKKTVRYDPDNFRFHYVLGLHYLVQQDCHPDGIKHMREFETKNPGYQPRELNEVRANLANCK